MVEQERFDLKQIIAKVRTEHPIPQITNTSYQRDNFTHKFLSELVYWFKNGGLAREKFRDAYFNRLKLIGVQGQAAQAAWAFDFQRVDSSDDQNYYRGVPWFRRQFFFNRESSISLSVCLPGLEEATLSELLLGTMDAWATYDHAKEIHNRNKELFEKYTGKRSLDALARMAPQGGGEYLHRFYEMVKGFRLSEEQAMLLKLNDIRDMQRLSFNLKVPQSWTTESTDAAAFKEDDMPYWAL